MYIINFKYERETIMKFKKILPVLFLSASIMMNSVSAFAQEKVLNISTNAEPPTIDPGLSTDTTSGSIIDNVFENLTEMDANREIGPGAAESWEVSEDGLVYTFNLRKDAVWSNGDPVTAQDFEYSWKRMLNPESLASRANLYYVIEGAEAYNLGDGDAESVGIKALDDYTFEVTLHSPVAYFLELINHYAFAPVNKNVVESDEGWALEAGDNYVTNGPFTLSEWNHNSDYVLSKNENYWDKENVQLDQVNVQIIESEATGSIQYMNGDLDFIGAPYGAIALENIPVLEGKGELHTTPYSAVYWYKLNTTDEVMSNVNIRKALALAIDRQALVDNVTHGKHIPANGIVPPTIEGFEESRNYFQDADFEVAKEYLSTGLEELGISDPSELTIRLSINTSEAHSTIAQFIQEGWNQNLGVNVEIDNTEWQVYLDKISMLDYQVARLGWAADYNDAASFLDMYRKVDTGNNDTGWESEEFKTLIDEASLELDASTRTDLLLQAEAVMMDAMPVIPIYHNESIYANKEYVKNMEPDALGRYNLKYVDVE